MAKIAGLPAFPPRSKLKLDKPAGKRGIVVRRIPALGLTITFRNGILWKVGNPRGKRGAVAIVETDLPGFTVIEDRAPFRTLAGGFRKAEKLAIRLALRGHRVVTSR